MGTDKAIISLAILKVNWDYKKHDYIESFIPFVVTLLNKKRYETIDVSRICKDFMEEFGLIIPEYPMMTILRRAKSRGYVKKVAKGILAPVIEKIEGEDFTTLSNQQVRIHSKVVDEFIKFADERFNKKLNKDDADKAFIDFLKQKDLQILFLADKNTVLPNVNVKHELRYMINSFISNAGQNEPTLFEYIKSIATGHVLAGTLLNAEFQRYKGKLTHVNLYIDTAILLNLLGLGGEPNSIMTKGFINMLIAAGTNLFVMKHTYDETKGVLEKSMRWIDSSKLDIKKASKATLFFIEEGYKSSDIERLIENMDIILDKYKIKIFDKSYIDTEDSYQIDEKKLEDVIIKTYMEHNPFFSEEENREILDKDIKSIALVNRLRQGNKPSRIKDAKHIFVTANYSLALANRKFERRESVSDGEDATDQYIIPACLTEVFVGTLVWLQSPTKLAEINDKKIIADCYSALRPDNLIMRKYYEEVENLKKKNEINSDEYFILRTSRVVRNMLSDKLLGEVEKLTPQTPKEILESIKEDAKKEGLADYLAEKEKHLTTLSELDEIRKVKEKTDKNIEGIARRVSKWGADFVFYLLLVVSVAGIFISGLNNIYITIIFGMIVLAGVIYGVNLKGIKGFIKESAYRAVYKFLIGN